ncbi:MAG: cupin [Actinomycetota bacterium]|nr:cupin [Actinomycetota bacterium]
MSTATSTTTIDDDRIRVTTWTFPTPGDSTGPHRHQYDYIVIPVTGGRLSVTTPDGEVHHMTQVAGVPYLGTAGTTHTVTTLEADPLTFVEIEFTS